MQGRPRKPSAIRVMEGMRGHRPLPPAEPKPKVGRPPCPKEFDAVARAEWNRQVPILERMRVLTEADRPALAAFCESVSRAAAAKAELKVYLAGKPCQMCESSGKIHEKPCGACDGKGRKPVSITDKQSLWLHRIIHREREIQGRIEQQFGLTPASRTRIAMEVEIPRSVNPIADAIAPRPKTA